MNIIFLHPESPREATSGSAVRPAKLKREFSRRQYSVLDISGDRASRVSKFKELKRRLNQGEIFDYLYVESLTRPMNLRIRSIGSIKFFSKENLDFDIIDFCLKNKIKTGFYLRDLHWDFSDEINTDRSIRNFYLTHYLKKYGRLELDFLKSRPIQVFGPSFRFVKYLEENYKVSAEPLHPGADPSNSSVREMGENLELFYVGGVAGIYNPEVFLKGIGETSRIHLTLCTRKGEWMQMSHLHGNPQVSVIHLFGNDLLPFYERAQIGVYSAPPFKYISLSFGVKLLEYVANGLPVIAFKGSEVADFIEKYEIGWTIDYTVDAVKQKLNWIFDHKEEYERIQRNVLDIQVKFTWSAVVDRLENILIKK